MPYYAVTYLSLKYCNTNKIFVNTLKIEYLKLSFFRFNMILFNPSTLNMLLEYTSTQVADINDRSHSTQPSFTGHKFFLYITFTQAAVDS